MSKRRTLCLWRYEGRASWLRLKVGGWHRLTTFRVRALEISRWNVMVWADLPNPKETPKVTAKGRR